MFGAFLRFLDKELPAAGPNPFSPPQLNEPETAEDRLVEVARHSFISEDRQRFSAEDDLRPKTVSESTGRRLYELGMMQKERRKRESQEGEMRRSELEVEEVTACPQISDMSREIAKELGRKDIIVENERWMRERQNWIAKETLKRKEKEVEENVKYKNKKWCNRSGVAAEYMGPRRGQGRYHHMCPLSPHSKIAGKSPSPKPAKGKAPIEDRLLEKMMRANKALDQKRFQERLAGSRSFVA